MNTIEQVDFEWEGTGIETDENYQRRLPEPSWEETSDFLFHRAAVELCDEISPHTLQEKYAEIVESEIEPIKDILPVPEQHIRMGNVSSERFSRVYYVRGETVIVPSVRYDGVARLVSNNKNAARDLRGKLINKLKELADRFHGAGIDSIDVYMGKDFTIENIEHPNAEMNIKLNEPEPFEKQVLEELTPLSESFVSNITVDFLDYSPGPEFDIIYASSPDTFIQVEVKDYSGTENEPGEEEAIHRPLRKASLLNINKTFTVIKGVSDERMDELEKNSELRNQIEIIQKEELTDIIQPLLESSITPTPYMFPQP